MPIVGVVAKPKSITSTPLSINNWVINSEIRIPEGLASLPISSSI